MSGASLTPRVIATDPGGRFCGIVVIKGDELLQATVITRTTGVDFPDAAYIHEVLSVIGEACVEERIIAVEGLVEPNPHMGITSVQGLMGTAMVLGAVLAEFREAVVVPPGGNGSGPDLAYPEPIRRYARLGGPSIHARSAYDVAIAGRRMARMEGALRG